MVTNILPADHPPLTLGVKISTFSEQCHVAYQIKGNHQCSSMVANDLPADPPDPKGQKVKIQLFQNMVILHIKFI